MVASENLSFVNSKLLAILVDLIIIVIIVREVDEQSRPVYTLGIHSPA